MAMTHEFLLYHKIKFSVPKYLIPPTELKQNWRLLGASLLTLLIEGFIN